jgi:2-polyprenyl-3-methyl-5-hydroxy-6-metoxy-1,4-benzoquinol methylase
MRSTGSRFSSERTIQSYEKSVREYARKVSARQRPRAFANALRRMVKHVPPGGLVLEVGSATGRDADFVESLGARVRRTDATQAFLDLQAERGKYGERLNLLSDTLGGPYDAILAIHVLIHVERARIDRVLRKISKALRPGGVFLVSLWEGTGATGGDYHTTYWSSAAFAARLTAAGLKVEWETRCVNSDGDPSLLFLARTPGRPERTAANSRNLGSVRARERRRGSKC